MRCLRRGAAVSDTGGAGRHSEVLPDPKSEAALTRLRPVNSVPSEHFSLPQPVVLVLTAALVGFALHLPADELRYFHEASAELKQSEHVPLVFPVSAAPYLPAVRGIDPFFLTVF